MHVISVNIGKAQRFDAAKPAGRTGIFKHAVATPVMVGSVGLAGDAICNTKHHGGPDQAVYVYGERDYAWWAAELGRVLEPGTFGENITIAGFASAQAAIGDRLTLGEVTLEVTAPRIPCATLARRMDDPDFIRKFREAERPGVYCRVIQAGLVQAGDAVSLLPYQGEAITILELFRDYYSRDRDRATIERFLAAPIAARVRSEKEAQLRKLLASLPGTTMA